MTSLVFWRPPWPRRPLKAICTWILGYSRLLISNQRSYDLQGCLDAAMASKAVRGNMHMDTIALVDAGIIGPLPSCSDTDVGNGGKYQEHFSF